MSVRVMVCQCAAAFSSAAAEFAFFEGSRGPEQSAAFGIVRRNVPVSCHTRACKCGPCRNTNQASSPWARPAGVAHSRATIPAAAIPTWSCARVTRRQGGLRHL
ncbi:hypothetical protein MTO96_017201 [Rhipicephalus appendiculatus]